MFGFSLAELFIVLLVILIFIKPKDLPEIAHFLGKVFYRIKSLFYELRNSFKEMEKELGVEDLRGEINRGIAEEKSKIEDLKDDSTVIVDMQGNEHRVPKIKDLRPDLTEEELGKEVDERNKNNSRI